MKQRILLTSLIISGLSLNAQNLTNVQMASVNYNNNTQVQQNVYLNNININEVQVQTNNNGGSSALQSLGNNSNKVKTTTVKQTNKQTNVNPVVNTEGNEQVNINVSRGNNFDINTNVLDNNVGNENRGRGGNIIVNDNAASNPVVNDTKKTTNNKPVIEYQGLDFKPSGLSGRDYSNGGKLKKGQKNFYTGSASKHKTIHKRKPNFKKVKHHTSKCAKW